MGKVVGHGKDKTLTDQGNADHNAHQKHKLADKNCRLGYVYRSSLEAHRGINTAVAEAQKVVLSPRSTAGVGDGGDRGRGRE